MDVTGARGTANVSADQRRIDMADRIDLLEPEWGPLTIISKRIRKRRTGNPLFKWMEDDSEARYDSVVGAQTNVEVTIEVADGTKFEQHEIVKNTATGELFRVTGVAGNVLTVVRGVGGGNLAMANGDELLIMGTLQPEGDTSKAARSDNPNTLSNYTGIFREPFEATETWRHSDNQVAPMDWAHQANKKGIEHRKDIEYHLIHGKPWEDLTGSQPRRGTGGVLHFITTNVTDAAGTLTETEFFTFLRSVSRYGSGRKLLLGSGLVLQVLNQFAQGKLETRQGESTYGLRVTRYQSAVGGSVDVVTHWLLEGNKYGGYGIVLDADELAYRYLSNSEGSRDTHIERDRQANDADTKKDEYLTEAGLQVGQEKKHGLLVGVTG